VVDRDIVLGIIGLAYNFGCLHRGRSIKYRGFWFESAGITSFVSRKQMNMRHCPRYNDRQLEKS
jgi:hypothetical protein